MLTSMNVEKWVAGVVPKTDLHLTENVIKMLIVITLQALLGRGIENKIETSISLTWSIITGGMVRWLKTSSKERCLT